MGRKQDQASSAKVPKDRAGKTVDHGRIGKSKQHGIPPKSDSIRRGPPRSKPGFSMYSSASEGTKATKTKNPRHADGIRKEPQRNQMVKAQETEVMSQMQIQAERLKSAQASGIVIPTADVDVPEDITLTGRLDFPEVSTPFNKRLVSSTPDPEKLLEAELFEQQVHISNQGDIGQSQPPKSPPQMIPERDTAKSINAPTVLASVASGLSEILKQQRHHLQDASVQKSNPQSQYTYQPWEHHLQQYQHSASLTQKGHAVAFQQEECEPHPQLPNIPPSPPLSPPLTVTKAEWVEDSHKEAFSNKSKTLNLTSLKQMKEDPVSTDSAFKHYHRSGVSSSLPATKTSYVVHDVISDSAERNAREKAVTGQSRGISAQISHPISKLGSCQQKAVADHYEEFASSKQTLPISKMTVENTSSISSTIITSGRSDKPSFTAAQTNSESVINKSSEDQKTVARGVFLSNLNERPSASPRSDQRADKAVSNAVPPIWVAKTQTARKIALQKEKTVTGNPKKPSSSKEKKKSIHVLDKRGEDIPPSTISGNEIISIPSADLPGHPIILSPEDKELVLPESHGMNRSADSCDVEVSDVISKFDVKKDESDTKVTNSERNIVDVNNENSQVAGRDTPSSDTENLSQVIEFLKTNAFNEMKTCEPNSNKDIDHDVMQKEMDVSAEESQKYSQAVSRVNEEEDTDSDNALSKLFKQYLPTAEKVKININNNNSKDSISEANDKSNDEIIKAVDDPEHMDKDLNQNAKGNVKWKTQFNDGSGPGVQPTTRTPKNLRYLEKMADPGLRDIACQLAFKATALRDVELRDLIDDMIFHTDAALGREDARFQSAQMFFAEENSKLKKRLQIVNRQLEAKERQERMGGGALGISNNDVLQLERKIMYLRQEKDKLDTQVTTLLEEKAKWLITQQDLIKTISLKDHELLKLEEKNHEEKKTLLQSLDQATKNSQGVHYKLSVADREISNLEQRLKCKDLDIGDLREKLKEVEASLRLCEAHSLKKDQEMMRLQDLVDTLKIGVDHVLQAYESGTSQQPTTTEQKQGIDNLRKMVHPEQYRLSRSAVSDPGHTQRHEAKAFKIREPHDDNYMIRTMPHHGNAGRDRQREPQLKYPETVRSSLSHRTRPKEADKYGNKHEQSQHMQHMPRGKAGRNGPKNALTPAALEEHNKRLSPIDRTLWRSLDDGPVAPPIRGEEPYYSDSEIQVNGRGGQRRSSQKYSHGAVEKSKPHTSDRGKTLKGAGVKSSQQKDLRFVSHDLEPQQRGERSEVVKSDRRRRKSESDKYGDKVGEDRNAINLRAVETDDDELESVSITSWTELNIADTTEEKSRYSASSGSRQLPRSSHLEKSHRTSKKNADNKVSEHRESQSTKYSTLRSDTLPESYSTSDRLKESKASQSTYYSTLRSKSLSDEPLLFETHQQSYMRNSEPEASHSSTSSPHPIRLRLSQSRDQYHSDGLQQQFPQETLLEDYSGTDYISESKSEPSPGYSGHRHDDAPFSSSGHEHFQRGSSIKDSTEPSDQEIHFATLRIDQPSESDYDPNKMSERQRQYHTSPYSRLHSHHLDAPGTSSEFDEFPHQYDHQSHKAIHCISLDGQEPDWSEEKEKYRLSRSLPSPQPYVYSRQEEGLQREDFMRESARNPSYSTHSNFFSGRSTLPTQSSPVHTSDISVSRRATRGSDNADLTQREFFQGTELSASLSSISTSDAESQNNNQLNSLSEDPFCSGIATLDAKIAMLQKKIDRTKAMFS